MLLRRVICYPPTWWHPYGCFCTRERDIISSTALTRANVTDPRHFAFWCSPKRWACGRTAKAQSSPATGLHGTTAVIAAQLLLFVLRGRAHIGQAMLLLGS